MSGPHAIMEKTYKADRVAVFANYRGGTPMHELMPRMAEQMWNYWKASKGLSAEAHLDNVTKGTAFNQGLICRRRRRTTTRWWNASTKCSQVAACQAPPLLIITAPPRTGKGANGTTVKWYPRPGSKGTSKNAVAFTFQMETVGSEYERAMSRVLMTIAGELARVWKSKDIKLVWHDSDSNYHAGHCMSSVSATGVWGVAPDRVTSDEINDAVMAAGFTEPISIVTRTMKHPGKQATLCAFHSNMGGEEQAEARDRLLALDGLQLIQKRIPSAEKASELAVQQLIREVKDGGDGTIQSTTLIPREMLAASWPANPTKWEFDDILHPSDWDSVQVCSDKRFAHYLGRLVLKEGMGEAKMQKTQQLLGRLGELRETLLGSIADIHTQEQAEAMAPLLKAAPPTLTLTLTLTTTLKPTLLTTPKARTNLQTAERIQEFTQVTDIGHAGNSTTLTAPTWNTGETVDTVSMKGWGGMGREM